MRQKIIFFDVDGTLYNDRGEIPASTREAIALAQRRKHMILLCTGRSRGEIGSQLLNLGLDGMIGSAGAFISYRGETVFHRPMEPGSVRQLVDFFEKESIPYVLETNEAACGKASGLHFIDQIMQDRRQKNPNLPDDFLGETRLVSDCRSITEVNKVLFFDAPFSREEMEKRFARDYTIVPNSIARYGHCSGEISEKGMSKAGGMERFLKLVQRSAEDTIAFGDGDNDMEMIQYAGIGVAMGNAVPELKEKADYVTESVDADGIYNAFVRFQLL